MLVKHRRNAAFTLIEIMIVLAIMAIVMGVAVNRIGQSAHRNMKKTAAKFASTIRYLYNKSAMEGIYIRLVLDLEANSYWVEATSDPVLISREETETPKTAKKETKGDKEKVSAKKDETETKDGAEKESSLLKDVNVEKLTPPEPKFAQKESYLLKASNLPEQVFFKDVWVEHKRYPIDAGKAEIYFFPGGYVEHAIINLRDKNDESHYSVETEALNGSASIESEYRQMGTGK